MNATLASSQRPEVTGAAHALFFASLFNDGRGLAFPCDAAGHVDIDELPQRARNNYFAARTLIGRDFATPKLVSAVAA